MYDPGNTWLCDVIRGSGGFFTNILLKLTVHPFHTLLISGKTKDVLILKVYV
jgi:hypothetical protein